MQKILKTDFIKEKSPLGKLFCAHSPKEMGSVYDNGKIIKTSCQCSKCGKIYFIKHKNIY